MNKKKARKTQERKDKKLRVYDGSVVALVSLIIRRKHYYDDFTQEVAEALDSQDMFCVQTEDLADSFEDTVEVFCLMEEVLKSRNNYKIVLELRTVTSNYYGILVEDKVCMFYPRYNSDIESINKKLAKPKVNTYSPDYIMQHIEPKVKELEKYNLVTQDLKEKLSFTKDLRKMRRFASSALSFKKKLFKEKVQLWF